MPPPADVFRSAAASLRASAGYAALGAVERQTFDRDLAHIEGALGGHAPRDPFAVSLATPNDLRAGAGLINVPPPAPPATPAAPPAPAARPGSELIGERARRALDAVDFTSFVAGLIQGTFQAIVDATAQQVREYARLVADLSKSVDAFSRENVTPNQVRDHLAQKHGADLSLRLPKPGEAAEPALGARPDADPSPAWLGQYGLAGETLTPELCEGPLLDAGRLSLAEERMRLLANMVLLGISRIVVDDGQLRARLQFHAKATESMTAEIAGGSAGQSGALSSRQVGAQSAVSTMVSTVNVNAQADVAIKADLVGEVFVKFRTETFSLDRFADAQAVALINRHAQGRATAPAQPSGVSAPATTPAASVEGPK